MTSPIESLSNWPVFKLEASIKELQKGGLPALRMYMPILEAVLAQKRAEENRARAECERKAQEEAALAEKRAECERKAQEEAVRLAAEKAALEAKAKAEAEAAQVLESKKRRDNLSEARSKNFQLKRCEKEKDETYVLHVSADELKHLQKNLSFFDEVTQEEIGRFCKINNVLHFYAFGLPISLQIEGELSESNYIFDNENSEIKLTAHFKPDDNLKIISDAKKIEYSGEINSSANISFETTANVVLNQNASIHNPEKMLSIITSAEITNNAKINAKHIIFKSGKDIHNLGKMSSDLFYEEADQSIDEGGENHFRAGHLKSKDVHVAGSIDANILDMETDHLPVKDFLMHRGSFQNIKADKGVHLTTKDPVNLDETINLSYSAIITAPTVAINAEVHGDQDLGLIATAGDVRTNKKVSANQNLFIDAKQSFYNDRADVGGGVGTFISTHDQVTNHAGTLRAGNYMQILTDGGNIVNEAIQHTVQEPHLTMEQYEPAQILGGAGTGNEGYGLYLKTPGKIINDASKIYSHGGNYLTADSGIDSVARFNPRIYHNEWRLLFRKKKTEEISWQTQPAIIFSEEGRNNLLSNNGAIDLLSSDLFGKAGNELSSKGDIKLKGLDLRQECKKDEKYFGGLVRDHSVERHDVNVPTESVTYKDTRMVSLNDVKILNALVIGRDLYLQGKNVIVTAPILNHSYEQEKWGFGIVWPDISMIPAYALYKDVEALKNSHRSLERVANVWNTGIDGVNTFSNVVKAARTGSPAALFNPTTSISYTHKDEKTSTQTVADNVGILCDGSMTIKADEKAEFSNGVPVQVKKDATIEASVFKQEGAGLKSHSESHTESFSAGVNLVLEPSVGVSESHSETEQKIYANQQFEVDGTLEVKAKKWEMQNANTTTERLTGEVEELSKTSSVNKTESKSTSASVTTSGFFSAHKSSSQSGTTGTKSEIQAKENDAVIGNVITQEEKEYDKKHSMGIAGSVKELQGRGSQAIPVLGVEVDHVPIKVPIPNQKGLEELKDNFDYLKGKQEEQPVPNIPQKVLDHKQTTKVSSEKDQGPIDKTQTEKTEIDISESSQQVLDEELTEEQLLALTNLADPKLPINEPLYSEVSRELSEVNRENLKSFSEWIMQDISDDLKNTYEAIKEASKHPINAIAKADISILKSAGILLFQPEKIGNQIYEYAKQTYDEYQSADPATQRKMLARGTVNLTKEVLLAAATGVVGELGFFGRTGMRAGEGVGKSLSAARRFEYECAPYHGKVGNPVKSKAPMNGQDALDVSVRVKSSSPRRVGIDPKTGEFVVFDCTRDNIYHGHVRSWEELHPDMKRALQHAGLVNKRGNKL